MDITNFNLPWIEFESDIERQQILLELKREINTEHILFGRIVSPIAKRLDSDDYIFKISQDSYALVHLTWSGVQEKNNLFPYTELFSNIDEYLICHPTR